uniref:Putative secreted peptide n=1 Tax=Anopheles braziliensis TaxID=58242 RepID=A0A2M3ZR04_9DIPT
MSGFCMLFLGRPGLISGAPGMGLFSGLTSGGSAFGSAILPPSDYNRFGAQRSTVTLPSMKILSNGMDSGLPRDTACKLDQLPNSR